MTQTLCQREVNFHIWSSSKESPLTKDFSLNLGFRWHSWKNCKKKHDKAECIRFFLLSPFFDKLESLLSYKYPIVCIDPPSTKAPLFFTLRCLPPFLPSLKIYIYGHLTISSSPCKEGSVFDKKRTRIYLSLHV